MRITNQLFYGWEARQKKDSKEEKDTPEIGQRREGNAAAMLILNCSDKCCSLGLMTGFKKSIPTFTTHQMPAWLSLRSSSFQIGNWRWKSHGPDGVRNFGIVGSDWRKAPCIDREKFQNASATQLDHASATASKLVDWSSDLFCLQVQNRGKTLHFYSSENVLR